MSKRKWQFLQKGLLRSSSGAALTEVVVAIIVLALIVVSVPPVLLLITKSQFSWHEQRVAESLSRNTMEYIKVISYEPGNGTNPEYNMEQIAEYAPETYEIDIIAQPIDPVTKEELPLESDPDVYDKGLQEITVSIYHVDRLILRTINYKVDRLDVLAL